MPLRSLILDHFWLKLFSLVLATLIWLAVQANLTNGALPTKKASGTDTRTFLHQPIMLLTQAAEHPAVSVTPDEVAVTVRGPFALIRELAASDIHVFIRLTERRRFSGDLPIHVHVPVGASITQITPPTAAVKPAPNP